MQTRDLPKIRELGSGLKVKPWLIKPNTNFFFCCTKITYLTYLLYFPHSSCIFCFTSQHFCCFCFENLLKPFQLSLLSNSQVLFRKHLFYDIFYKKFRSHPLFHAQLSVRFTSYVCICHIIVLYIICPLSVS